ncbi:MAG: hypothetical protein EOO11_12915 [Chitinophagaceae bacterium]|nr:MAG: hypothetical protein EOO11_12915 [Chitinophagaceae bacterium]
MHYKALFTTLFLSALAAFSGCAYDKDELPDPAACGASATTYRQHVLPVLQNTCYTCHSNAVADRFGGNVKLEGHANIQPWALNGQLLQVVQHAPNVPAMPQGGAKLDDCSIARFSAWAAAGAPDN